MHADGTQGSGCRWRAAHAALLALTLAQSGCLMDDSRCSANQRVSAGALLSCQCEAGYVLGPQGYGCVPCPANSSPTTSGTCACNAGFEHPSGNSVDCVAIEGSFPGKPCSEAEPCSAPAGYCAIAEAEPYCAAEGCTKNADCAENWRCKKSGTHAYCAKPPTGLGDPCTTQAECTGKEANYCEVLAAHVCLPDNCLSDLSVCPSGFSCCDFTSFLGTSLCVVDGFLSGGSCPGGAAPVKQ